MLRHQVATDDTGRYGVATWKMLRAAPDRNVCPLLFKLIRRAEHAAEAVGNDNHSLEAIQLPFNIVMADALTIGVHNTDAGKVMGMLWYVHEHDLHTFASANPM